MPPGSRLPCAPPACWQPWKALATRQVAHPSSSWRTTTAKIPVRTQNAGRITPEMGLSESDWQVFAAGRREAWRGRCKQETGLRTVFHHHCAGYVETPAEIEQLLSLTDPALLGLVPRHRSLPLRRRRPAGRPAAARRAGLACPLQGLPARGWRRSRAPRAGITSPRSGMGSSASWARAQSTSRPWSTSSEPPGLPGLDRGRTGRPARDGLAPKLRRCATAISALDWAMTIKQMKREAIKNAKEI